ncbi:hypothetical protein ZEAMMB73_Zm00001d018465 [Zea mays]|uniref:Uncharacterized protein n=1 Tax=Zea mays TaxID=4577 RepID=A0A1D6HP82_MAIZE|nr:hypothetical protein ZEAMMB73_Zm00001d018465 [Zea mays]AQK76083.1 hypothetical protein ZEAMMB73_Zm00001d018465 [Zea mays]
MSSLCHFLLLDICEFLQQIGCK